LLGDRVYDDITSAAQLKLCAHTQLLLASAFQCFFPADVGGGQGLALHRLPDTHPPVRTRVLGNGVEQRIGRYRARNQGSRKFSSVTLWFFLPTVGRVRRSKKIVCVSHVYLATFDNFVSIARLSATRKSFFGSCW